MECKNEIQNTNKVHRLPLSVAKCPFFKQVSFCHERFGNSPRTRRVPGVHRGNNSQRGVVHSVKSARHRSGASSALAVKEPCLRIGGENALE